MTLCGDAAGVRLAAVATVAGLGMAAAAANPEVGTRVEISEDGRQRVELPSVPHAAFGAIVERSGLTFGTSPDVEVMLRRQIGGLKIADMNGDGNNDLVAVCYISNSFPPYDDWRDQIYFGTGSGIEIVPGWVSSLQTHTGDVQIGDINADGRPDAVTVHGGGVRSDHVRVYFGADGMPSTTEGFTSSFSQRGWGTSGVVFDIDDDGDLDVFTTNQGLSPDPFRPMTLYRNLGTGLATMPDWISSERSIQGGASVGDADGDGDLDIGVSRWANFFTGIIENNGGTPSEVPALFAVNTDSTDRGTAFADIDGDGDDDFAVGGADGPEVYDNAAGVFSSAWVGTPPFTGVQDFGAFDVDGDGDEDIVEIHFSDGRAHIYENVRGALDVAPTWTFDAPEVGTAIAVGDLNGDGRADLALGYAGNTSIRVFYAEAPDCPADLAFPFGVVDLSDVDAFIVAFVVGDSLADLAVPFGFVDLSDVDAFIASFVAGCP